MDRTTNAEPGTLDRQALAAKALGSAQSFLESALTEIPSVANTVRDGGPQSAGGDLALLLDGIRSLSTLAVALEQIEGPVAESGIQESLARMSASIRTMVDAQEARDWNTMADALEGPIRTELTVWQERFARSVATLGALG